MLLLLQENHPCLDKEKVLIVKIGEKQVVDHLFEFDYGVSMKFTWPQGACHKHGIFEKVLSEWRAHIGGSRISRFLGEVFSSQDIIRVDWNLLGVYSLVPPDTPESVSCKTHVKHKPTGILIPIPASLNVDNTWTFTENWSDTDAALVDADGFGWKVTKFVDVACSGVPTMEQWINFASRRGAAMEAQAVRMFVKSLPRLRHTWFWEALAAFLFPPHFSIGSQQFALSK